MTLYLFWGIPAKYNLPVENFHPYGVQSSKVKEGCTVFPMQQNLSYLSKDDMCKLLFSECFLDIRCSSRALALCLSYLILFLQNLHGALAPSEAGTCISHSLYATSFNQFGLKETRLFVVSALSYFVSILLKHVLNCFQYV